MSAFPASVKRPKPVVLLILDSFLSERRPTVGVANEKS